MSKRKGLTEKQELFAREYLVDFNATAAYIRAGYKGKGAGQSGHALLKNPEIQKLLATLRHKREILIENTGAQVVQELWRVYARCMQDQAVLDEDGNPTGVYVFKDGTSLRTLEVLGKHHGIFAPDAGGDEPIPLGQRKALDFDEDNAAARDYIKNG